MKRYLDLYEKKQCVELDIKDGSEASKAPEAAFESVFGTKVKEVSRQKYQSLKEEYTK